MKPLRDLAAASAVLGLVVIAATGCTIRYSQTLVGSIERFSGRPSTNSSSGFEIGGGNGQAGITLSEPADVDELMRPRCDVALGQADYRGTWFSLIYLSLNFPKTETIAYCVD